MPADGLPGPVFWPLVAPLPPMLAAVPLLLDRPAIAPPAGRAGARHPGRRRAVLASDSGGWQAETAAGPWRRRSHDGGRRGGTTLADLDDDVAELLRIGQPAQGVDR